MFPTTRPFLRTLVASATVIAAIGCAKLGGPKPEVMKGPGIASRQESTVADRTSDLGAADYGFTYCDGTLGSFDVYLVRTARNPARYELTVVTVSLTQSPEKAGIHLAGSTPTFRTLLEPVDLFPGEEVLAGTLEETDLATYDLLAITPHEPGKNFLQQTPARDAICTLPIPGTPAR